MATHPHCGRRSFWCLNLRRKMDWFCTMANGMMERMILSPSFWVELSSNLLSISEMVSPFYGIPYTITTCYLFFFMSLSCTLPINFFISLNIYLGLLRQFYWMSGTRYEFLGQVDSQKWSLLKEINLICVIRRVKHPAELSRNLSSIRIYILEAFPPFPSFLHIFPYVKPSSDAYKR